MWSGVRVVYERQVGTIINEEGAIAGPLLPFPAVPGRDTYFFFAAFFLGEDFFAAAFLEAAFFGAAFLAAAFFFAMMLGPFMV